MSKLRCKICGGKGYHKLSCPNNPVKPKKINVDIKPKARSKELDRRTFNKLMDYE